MKFRCQYCDFEKPANKKHAGRKVRCPNCSRSTRIGGENVDSPSESSDLLSGVDSSEFSELQVALAESATAPPLSPVEPSASPPHSAAVAATIAQYEIRSGKLGESVAYGCPGCNSRLTSSLQEAGGSDQCPDCGFNFIVPGDKERATTQERRIQASQRKADEREKRNEASSQAVVNRVAEQHQREGELQLDRDPMIEWYIYAVVLIGVFALASGNYIVSAVQTDDSYICLVIMLLFLVGAAVNFIGMRGLKNEYVCAAVLMNSLKSGNGLGKICQEPPAGVFHQHVVDLGNIAKHDSGFTQDSLITLLYSRMMAKSKMVDVLGGVLVTLGLIGTIVGLISMTDGLSLTLASLGEDGDSGDLLSGMRSTMSGLGTAFNTTLVGAILGSVVLRILNNVYTSNVDHLVTYVAKTTEVKIVPRLKRKSRLALQEAV